MPTRLAVAALAFAVPSAAYAQGDPLSEPFPAVLDLGDLDGQIGFRVSGAMTDARLGTSVAGAGDLNGDGLDDFVIGSPGLTGTTPTPGEVFVVFGVSDSSAFPRSLDVTDLDGTNGFRAFGISTFSRTGYRVSSGGDINGDGIDDLVIGAMQESPRGEYHAGSTYVVFGRDTTQGKSFPSSLFLALLNGDDGFRFDGDQRGDRAGFAAGIIGDVNHDGIDDIAIGARFADPAGLLTAGSVYVVFGRDATIGHAFPEIVNPSDLNGMNGFVVHGSAADDALGASVGAAGDFNGDGIDDFIVGATGADSPSAIGVGKSYVLYGRDQASGQQFPREFVAEEMTALEGLILIGDDRFDSSGRSVGYAGDLNADGFGDVIIGASDADPVGRSGAGESYVIYGRGDMPGSLELGSLDGSDGFVVYGVDRSDFSGTSVAYAGDLDGDGISDVVVGASGADTGAGVDSGEAYVLFGSAVSSGLPAIVDLALLEPPLGFRLTGRNEDDLAGVSVAHAGDVNGDGRADLVIGASHASPSDVQQAGEAYIVFGRNAPAPGPCPADLDEDGALTIFDFLAFQGLFSLRDPRADWDEDGAFTIFDFLAFQTAFDAGCP